MLWGHVDLTHACRWLWDNTCHKIRNDKDEFKIETSSLTIHRYTDTAAAVFIKNNTRIVLIHCKDSRRLTGLFVYFCQNRIQSTITMAIDYNCFRAIIMLQKSNQLSVVITLLSGLRKDRFCMSVRVVLVSLLDNGRRLYADIKLLMS